MSIFIPKWAFVGVATAYVLLLSAEGIAIDSRSTQFYIGPEDTKPPLIHLLSPGNLTYVTDYLPLAFTVDETPSWTGYNLDRRDNVTVAGNTTLISLTNGLHSVIVYANDTSGNVGCSEDVFFSVLVIHDLVIGNVTLSKTVVGQGYAVSLNVTIENKGHYPEGFNVTAYANTTIMDKKAVTLAGENSANIILTWNTAGVSKGNYTVIVRVPPLLDEVNTRDNTLSVGWIVVTRPGDVNGDRKVDGRDIALVTNHFSTYYGQLGFLPNADINGDGKIDGKDMAILTKNFGQT